MYKHLLRPFAYLSIDHDKKWRVDWFYPLIMAIFSTFLIIWIKQFGTVMIFTDNGLVSKILSFIQNLPGFFIAALAAIATFNRIDIDKTMPAPTMDIKIRGETIAIALTRRRFLCSMFAFLTAENIILIVLGVFAQTLAIPIKTLIKPSLHALVSGVFVFTYLLFFWQMLVASFWGLFYLGERLHQPDAQ